MSDGRAAAGGGGVGFLGLLTILFIALKLTGVITWSWVWVLAPLWIPFGIFGIIMIFALAVIGIVGLVTVIKGEPKATKIKFTRRW